MILQISKELNIDEVFQFVMSWLKKNVIGKDHVNIDV
jgi:hypothetical protein